ncbi:MAG: hypothetical protein R2861_14080 [Desulfobacterales bacterium]
MESLRPADLRRKTIIRHLAYLHRYQPGRHHPYIRTRRHLYTAMDHRYFQLSGLSKELP